MICPHCSHVTPEYKRQWTPEAAPKKGNFWFCLECTGFSVIIGRDALRACVKSERDAIARNAQVMHILNTARKLF